MIPAELMSSCPIPSFSFSVVSRPPLLASSSDEVSSFDPLLICFMIYASESACFLLDHYSLYLYSKLAFNPPVPSVSSPPHMFFIVCLLTVLYTFCLGANRAFGSCLEPTQDYKNPEPALRFKGSTVERQLYSETIIQTAVHLTAVKRNAKRSPSLS